MPHAAAEALRCAVAATALLLGVVADAAAVDFITPRSLAFLEARGGIDVGVPEYVDGEWRLPLNCDLSGVGSLNQPGNVLHSGLAWWRSVAQIRGKRIELTIESNVQGPDAPSARCGPARLGAISEGTFEVFYLDPDGTRTRLGEVTVTR